MPEFSAANLPLLLALLVPGFVWWKVHQYFQITRVEAKQSWLGVFSLSAINYAAWSWWIPRLWTTTAAAMNALLASNQELGATEQPVLDSAVSMPVAGWLIITFISPAVFGIITGYSQRSGWWRRMLVSGLGLNIPHPVETGWEYVFGQGEWFWTSVTLTDGSVVEGIFGARSLASSSSGERDLYLEQYFERRGDKLVIGDHDAGIWIRSDMIKAIAFKNLRSKRSEKTDA